MYYLLALGAAIVFGGVLVKIDSSKNKKKGAHLQKLYNSDIPCGEAFESLELAHSWGENSNDKK